jgi:hypothetical protein
LCVCVCVCVCVVLGLELRAFIWSHYTSPIFVKGFQDRVSRTVCPGWFQTTILLISASWVARITGMSHWRPAVLGIFEIGSLKRLAQAAFELW